MTLVVQVTLIAVHILAAVVWIGGMAFLGLVVVPVMRSNGRGREASEFFHLAALRFRTVGWVCIVLLLLTGILNLDRWGVGWSQLASASFWGSAFGQTLAVKLTLILIIVLLSGVHDFFIGPRASIAISERPASADARRLRAAASWFGRVNSLLAVAVVVYAVMLVRGVG